MVKKSVEQCDEGAIIKIFHTVLNKQTCCPLLLLPTSPVFKGEVVDAAPVLIPGVVEVGVVVALLSGGKKPVADIGTTSKNCFW